LISILVLQHFFVLQTVVSITHHVNYASTLQLLLNFLSSTNHSSISQEFYESRGCIIVYFAHLAAVTELKHKKCHSLTFT